MDKKFVSDDGVFVSVRMTHGRWFVGRGTSQEAADLKMIEHIHVYETETRLRAERRLQARNKLSIETEHVVDKRAALDSVIAIALTFALGLMTWVWLSV